MKEIDKKENLESLYKKMIAEIQDYAIGSGWNYFNLEQRCRKN